MPMICIWFSHFVTSYFINIQNVSAFVMLPFRYCPEKQTIKWLSLLLLLLLFRVILIYPVE